MQLDLVCRGSAQARLKARALCNASDAASYETLESCSQLLCISKCEVGDEGLGFGQRDVPRLNRYESTIDFKVPSVQHT